MRLRNDWGCLMFFSREFRVAAKRFAVVTPLSAVAVDLIASGDGALSRLTAHAKRSLEPSGRIRAVATEPPPNRGKPSNSFRGAARDRVAGYCASSRSPRRWRR